MTDFALSIGTNEGEFRLSSDWLVSCIFQLRAEPSNEVLATSLWFEPDGRISGYHHRNASGWRIEDGKLFILRDDGIPTCSLGPMRRDNGRVSLIGQFINASSPTVPSGTIYHLDEVTDATERMQVQTFDLLDTLVARRCYEPLAIFRQVEAKCGVVGFARLRHEVEMKLFGRRDYGLDDIYAELNSVTGWRDPLLRTLRIMELAEEWENLFAIREIVARVRPQDMIISDMYLPLGFVRCVVDEKCGLRGQTIHLSNYGKHHGIIWPRILATHGISRHYGDNHWTDVESPKRSGIDTEQVTLAGWTRGEKILVDSGLLPFAQAIREARLGSFDLDPALRAAQLAQFDLNLPLLVLGSLYVLRRAREQEVDTLLMCSRDCNLWVGLMRWLASCSSASPVVRYLRASRTLFYSDSAEYAAYYMRMHGKRTMLIDLVGTGRSPAHFITQLGMKDRIVSFLLTAEPTTGASPIGDVKVEILSEQPFYTTRLVLEALNMSLEGMAESVAFNGHKLQVEQRQNEFSPTSQSIISAMRKAFLSATTILRRATPGRIPEHLSEATLSSAVEAVLALAPDHCKAVEPISDDILQEESRTTE